MSLILPLRNDKISTATVLGFPGRRGVSTTGFGSGGSSVGSTTTVVDPTAVHRVVADVATTGNITLSGVQSLDGQTGSAGQTVLVRAQSTASQNGLYTMETGAWIRVENSVGITTLVRVLAGTTWGGAWLKLNGSSEPTIGTDSITYTRIVTGSGSTNVVPRWSAGNLVDGVILDDGSRVRINTAFTTGRLSIGDSSAGGTALWVENTSTASGVGSGISASTATVSGAGVDGRATGSSGIGVEGLATGVTGQGVHGDGFYGVYGTTTNGLSALRGASFGSGLALTAVRNVSSATSQVALIQQQHASSSGVALAVEQSGSGHGLQVTGGSGRTAYLTRNNSGATEPVVEILQQHASNAKNALHVTNSGTSANATGGWFIATGGIGVFTESKGRESLYVYRNTGSLSTPTARFWQNVAGDANPVVLIESAGTGPMIEAKDGGTTRLKLEDGGVLDLTNSGVLYNSVIKSANYTLTNSDSVVFADTTAAAGAFTLTLPATPRAGKWFLILDRTNNAATNNVTLARNGNNINGVGADVTYIGNGFRIFVFSDGSNWFTH